MVPCRWYSIYAHAWSIYTVDADEELTFLYAGLTVIMVELDWISTLTLGVEKADDNVDD
jgi:hypothetical protein